MCENSSGGRDPEVERLILCRFGVTESIWLATSTAVDIVICLVLSGELFYARHTLALKGGSMREVVTRLIVSDAAKKRVR
jgi:hypothetical protein